MLSEKELVIETLFDLAEQIKSLPDIARFIEKVLNEPMLKEQLECLYEKWTEQEQPTRAIIDKIGKKMFPVCRKFLTYIKKYNVAIDQDPTALVKYEDVLANKSELNPNAIFMQFIFLKKAFMALYQDTSRDHTYFIKKYIDINDAKFPQTVSFICGLNTLFAQLSEEMKYSNRMDETKDWFSFFVLISFVEVYDPKKYIEIKKRFNKKKYIIAETILTIRDKALARKIDDKNKMAVLQRRVDQVYLDKLDKKISEEFWQTQSKNWIEEKESLAVKLLSMQKADTTYLENANLILELSEKAADMFRRRNADQKHNLVKIITSNFSYMDGKLDLELKPVFKIIMKTVDSGKWLPGQDSNLRPND